MVGKETVEREQEEHYAVFEYKGNRAQGIQVLSWNYDVRRTDRVILTVFLQQNGIISRKMFSVPALRMISAS